MKIVKPATQSKKMPSIEVLYFWDGSTVSLSLKTSMPNSHAILWTRTQTGLSPGGLDLRLNLTNRYGSALSHRFHQSLIQISVIVFES